jgi:lipopolysaccharide transport system permease protein
MNMIRAVWAYRGFILGSVKREFQSKYRNSLLGVAWPVLNPLAMIVVYTVIFSQVMRAKLPGVDSTFAYSIYLCAGILSWGLFSEITTRSQNMFLDHANLLKKLSFPKLCLPVTVAATGLINFAIVFGLFVAFLLITGNFPGWAFLALLPVLSLLVVFAAGLGIILGVLNVFFRDVGHFFGVFITFWFWLTPIVYPAAILPERAKLLLGINPMAPIIGTVQDIVVKGAWPDWIALLYPAAITLGLCWIGLRLFRKRAGEMIDEL